MKLRKINHGYLKINMPHSKAFKQLLESTRKTYLYKDVPNKYKKRYGKTYDKKEIKSVAIAIAKSRGLKIDRA